MKTIEVKDELDLKMEEARTTNKVMLDLQAGKYDGLRISQAMEAHRKYKLENNDFDWSDEEREV